MTEYKPLNVLIADDGSSHSQAAMQLLCDLPLPPGTSLTILAVLSTREGSQTAHRRAALKAAHKHMEHPARTVQSKLVVGVPADTIILHADRMEPDMIVMGAQGLRATLGILLGGVAQQVVEYAQWPVLVVRAPYEGIRRVLLVTDGSFHSGLAVQCLTGHRADGGSEQCKRFPLPEEVDLRVMHVLPPIPAPVYATEIWPAVPEILPPVRQQASFEQEEWLEKEKKLGEELLDQTVTKLAGAGLQAVPVLRRGDAATEIISYVSSHHIDLIVAGSRGLSRMSSWLLGSVSRKLVHYSGCSVLIVKGKEYGES